MPGIGGGLLRLGQLGLGLRDGVVGARPGGAVGARLVGREAGLRGGEVRLGDLEGELGTGRVGRGQDVAGVTTLPTVVLTAVTGQTVDDPELPFELLLELLDELLDDEELAGCGATPNDIEYVVAAETLPVAAALSVTSRRVTAAVRY